ncbi:unnamed protein product [Linum tenue]|uniref:DUF1221 domain-containing protein n=1 Tax=Linum tenue TaxID=586396 RepID=A0AAV0I9M9_9ROSI|nr:unnamed protein product [Linum tenue]
MLWGKALHLHHNRECVEFHIHNLISAMPAATEAINIAGKELQLLVDEAVLAVGRSNSEETGRELEAFPQFDSSRRSLIDNVDPMVPGISRLSSRSHPNILQLLCGFTNEDKKECFLVTELMSCRDIESYIKKV